MQRRLEVGAEEERLGRQIADYVVVNDDVDRAAERGRGYTRRSPLRPLRRAWPVRARGRPPDRDLTTETTRSMPDRHPTMMEPPVEDLLDRVDSKFTLVSLAAMRAGRSTPTSTSSARAWAPSCRRR